MSIFEKSWGILEEMATLETRIAEKAHTIRKAVEEVLHLLEKGTASVEDLKNAMLENRLFPTFEEFARKYLLPPLDEVTDVLLLTDRLALENFLKQYVPARTVFHSAYSFAKYLGTACYIERQYQEMDVSKIPADTFFKAFLKGSSQLKDWNNILSLEHQILRQERLKLCYPWVSKRYAEYAKETGVDEVFKPTRFDRWWLKDYYTSPTCPCPYDEILYFNYFQGNLDRELAEAVGKHLAFCPKCTVYLKSLKRKSKDSLQN